jgi:diadenosine tetraphosphate (Ap4A) HIT family hydrolase
MFELHHRLDADTVFVSKLGLSRLLLLNDRRYRWLVLVPELPDLRELHDLSAENQALLMAEITQMSRLLQSSQNTPDKINVGMLGNMVPQLHIHVIARHAGDPAWPGPVWGHSPAEPHESKELVQVIEGLRQALCEPA